MDIIIRNVPDEIIKILDKVSKEESLSRNALIIKIIGNYAKSKDDFVVNFLPTIVRALVKDELEKLTEASETTINNVYFASEKMIKATEKIENLLTETIKNTAKNELDDKDFLRILEISET